MNVMKSEENYFGKSMVIYHLVGNGNMKMLMMRLYYFRMVQNLLLHLLNNQVNALNTFWLRLFYTFTVEKFFGIGKVDPKLLEYFKGLQTIFFSYPDQVRNQIKFLIAQIEWNQHGSSVKNAISIFR